VKFAGGFENHPVFLKNRYSTGSWILLLEAVSEVVPSAFVTVVVPEGGFAAGFED